MVGPRLIDVLLAELDGPALDQLADRLADRVASRITHATPVADGWLDTVRAAAYLGISTNALNKLTASRAITFEQEASGCKCWFQRADLATCPG
jgi:hypothetical protein